MQRIFLPVLATLALSAGCYSQGDVGVGYSYGYAAPAPDMYYVSPGVSVVAYSDYPVFYSDNYYWRYDGGIWYRSGYYNSGWVASYDVPYNVRGIQRPQSYARFQPGVGWSRTSPTYSGGTYQGGTYQGGVRDHRTTTYAPATRGGATYAPPAAAPAVRDHRTETYAPAASTRQGPPSAPAARDHRRR